MALPGTARPIPACRRSPSRSPAPAGTAAASLGHAQIAVADDLAVTGVERDLAALDRRYHAKTVPLALEDPSWVVKRRVGQRGQHGLQPPGELGLSWHGSHYGKTCRPAPRTSYKAAPRAASARQGLAHRSFAGEFRGPL